MSGRRFAVITGGGTGGHVSPALAIGEALVASGRRSEEIGFVGSTRGLEARLVPAAGFPLELLPGRGLERRISLQNLGALGGLGLAVLAALRLAHRDRPRVVVTVGGFAGFPYALAAIALRIPLLVVNVDAVPGAANRAVAPFAAAAAVAFPGTPLPRATVTGPPVRAAVLAVSRSADERRATRLRIGIEPARRLVVVTGGSLGARTLNEAALGLAELWRSRSDLAVYHVAGERNLGEVQAAASARGLFRGGGGLDYRLVGFDPELVAVLGACDLAVCRAGASTVAELTAIGVPSVLVPLPGAPGDHQTRNAQALERAGAAKLVPDGALEPRLLASLLEECWGSRDRLAAMEQAARGLGRRDAAERIAEMASELATRPGRRRSG
ncbi:MAG TPA: UDP-N-acetylglucosamine--N-acetylmuramyl-(pentapeptide) pyrophosphoryl-undecaprenol N-acetylglucosamine transferase [Acidimicrobiales bacterium]|nr:UDP-N-acetylglucosamine--N-acetylmuramyl-(pentapeptide) pyrophosphoryl-undecaprenol N-acetylglucosamine transferase [Acidimicrobiales bacterium]